MWLQVNYVLLLMKQQVDNLVAQDQQLQEFLTWVSLKSQAVPAANKPVTVRAFYFDLAMTRALALVGGTLDLARAFNQSLTCNLERDLALDLALDRALGLDQVFALTPDPNLVSECVLERALAHARGLEPMLQRSLLKLKEELPYLALDTNKFKQWWLAHGGAWTEQLRAVLIEYRHIGQDWQFSDQQKEALLQYYNANCWLVNCLNNDRYITSVVREAIEKTLLLPMAEISLPHLPEWS